MSGCGRLDTQGDDEGNERDNDDECVGTAAGADGDEQSDRRDQSPHDGLGIEECEHAEGDHAEQSADEIELIGVEIAEPAEGAGDAVTEARHHHRDGDEDDG